VASERPPDHDYPALPAGNLGRDAEQIGFCSYPRSRTLAGLLIDCEDDRALRAVLVGMLREAQRLR
jgi:hypothetical protein